MTRIFRLGAIAASGLLAAGLVSTALAQAPNGDAIYHNGIPGKAAACASCHGARAEGGGNGQFPRLAGLPDAYVKLQLQHFRDGKRANAIMAPTAKSLDDAQISALASYLAALKAPLTAAPRPAPAAAKAGALLVAAGDPGRGVPACRDCHGPGLEGGGPDIPPLLGQSAAYLSAQLAAYKSGSRPGGPLDLMHRIASALDESQMRDAGAYIAALAPGERPQIPRPAKSAWKPHAQSPDSFVPPPVTALPAQPEERDAVLLGERIFHDTPKYAAKYVGNRLSCRNCHLEGGRSAVSAPMWAAVPRYPMYRGKNKVVNTLAMRIQGCFRYSENGKPPPAESPAMVALLNYMHWMATGLPLGIKPKASGYPKLAAPKEAPSRERGEAVYAAHCAVCHADDGQGRRVAGAQVFPPLWGPHSFNWGAGMHRVNTAAAFVHANMPFGAPGSLTAQQAWDVAAWLDSQPRPQDPRFDGNVEQTRARFHKHHAYDFYGQTVDGMILGAPGTLERWAKSHPANGAH